MVHDIILVAVGLVLGGCFGYLEGMWRKCPTTYEYACPKPRCGFTYESTDHDLVVAMGLDHVTHKHGG